MTIKKTWEIDSIKEFEAWSGARERLDEVIKEGWVGRLDSIVQDIFCGEVDETQLNDFLWFDIDDYLEEWRAEKAEAENEDEDEEGDEE